MFSNSRLPETSTMVPTVLAEGEGGDPTAASAAEKAARAEGESAEAAKGLAAAAEGEYNEAKEGGGKGRGGNRGAAVAPGDEEAAGNGTRAEAAAIEAQIFAPGKNVAARRSFGKSRWKALALQNKVFMQMTEPKRLSLMHSWLSLPTELYKECFPFPGPVRGDMTLIVKVPEGAGKGKHEEVGGGGAEVQHSQKQQKHTGAQQQQQRKHTGEEQQQHTGEQQQQQQKQHTGEQRQQQQVYEHEQKEKPQQEQLSADQQWLPEAEGCREGSLHDQLMQVGSLVEVLRLQTHLTCRNSIDSNEKISRPALKGVKQLLESYSGWRIYMWEAVGISAAASAVCWPLEPLVPPTWLLSKWPCLGELGLFALA
jgi:hypothetical protein